AWRAFACALRPVRWMVRWDWNRFQPFCARSSAARLRAAPIKIEQPSAGTRLQTEIFADTLEGIGFIQGIEMEAVHAEADQILALPARVLDAHFHRPLVVVFHPRQLALEPGRNFCAAQRRKAAHLRDG